MSGEGETWRKETVQATPGQGSVARVLHFWGDEEKKGWVYLMTDLRLW